MFLLLRVLAVPKPLKSSQYCWGDLTAQSALSHGNVHAIFAECINLARTNRRGRASLSKVSLIFQQGHAIIHIKLL